MSEEHVRKERLQLLLQQLQIHAPIREAHFQDGKIRKLVISKQNRSWHFHIELDNIIPADVYTLFVERMNSTFENIATVTFTFHYINTKIQETDVIAYWPLIIKNIPSISAGIQ